MIIKLKGANFSTNNINALLNSYFVSITGGNCVTATDNISSVSKDGAIYSNTFTVNTDYSVSDVKVIMGGTDITSTAANAVSGNGGAGSVITVYVPAVTGNISITFTYVYSGAEEPENPGSGEINEDIPVTFYDHSNGNDWYVMYSKNDESAGTTPIRYGLNTSNSEKAKNYVCALENGATYRITFKNNTAGAYRCRIVTFSQPYNSILKSALSADANTGTTTTNVIYYDRDNTVSEYTTTFTNTLNHKTLAMTLGWAAAAKGNVDIDVTVTKIGEGTPETDDGELVTGLYTAKDFFLKTGTDSTGAAITVPVTSNTNKARNFVCELEDGATYTYSYTNGGATSTYRAVIATFAPTMNNIKIAPLGDTVSGIDASTVSGAVKVLHEVAKETEGTYTGTFTNTENAKTLIMFVG